MPRKKVHDLRKKNKKGEEYYFQAGRLMAYNEVISHLLNQAEVFGIRKDMGKELKILKGFDPDKELI